MSTKRPYNSYGLVYLLVYSFQLCIAATDPPFDFNDTIGYVLFRDFEESANYLEYLLVQLSFDPQHWTLPRGHKNLTELAQQLSLVAGDLHQIPKFEKPLRYLVSYKEVNMKFYLVEMVNPDKEVKLLKEGMYKEFEWVPFMEAQKRLKDKAQMNILKYGRHHLESMALIDKSDGPDIM